MATLTGNAINTSYQGLIKTIDNAVLGINSTKVITDGEGNLTPLALAQSSLLIGSQTAATTVELFSSNLTLADQTATNGFILNSTNLAFAGAIDFTGSTVSGLPAGSDTTYDLGSAQSTNDVDVTLTGSDATIDTIKMVAGTNITLTDNGSNQITIDAAGGGGGDTDPISYLTLPAVAHDLFQTGGSEETYRANQIVDGYTNTNSLGGVTAPGNVGFTIFPMSPGETLNKLKFRVNTAFSGTGQLMKLAVYDLTYRQGGGVGEYSSGIVPYNKVKDLGSIAVDAIGPKTIDISGNPYVMPTDATYGAIAIAWALDTPGYNPQIAAWNNAIWNGNSAVIQGSTTYRNIQPYFENILDGTNNYDLPADLSDPTFKALGATSNPIWMVIQTKL